jgi:hypothetical protein
MHDQSDITDARSQASCEIIQLTDRTIPFEELAKGALAREVRKARSRKNVLN